MDTRKIAADALIVIAVVLGLTALVWAAPAQRINGFAVGAGLAVLGLLGRSYIRGVFYLAAAVSVWLFFSPWVLSGGAAGIVVLDTVLGALAFGFSGSAIAERVASITSPEDAVP